MNAIVHPPSSSSLLEMRGLQVEFDTWDGRVRVIESLGLDLEPGETLCIVGESGCGKSMTALAIMGLVPQPTGHITGGSIRLQGENLVCAEPARMQQVRGNKIAMIFQEPMTSLNPVYTVGEQIAEALRLHKGMAGDQAHSKAIEALRAVHIPEAERRVDDYPHQFSGGMRQRVMIAIALACEPKILIADEPTTALDVTVQAQIFDLLQDLREAHGTALILITHDMGAVAEMADRVIVMYAGRKVEEGRVEDILERPAHPYTQGLLACRPRLVLGEVAMRKPLAEIPGVVPPLHMLGTGCAFSPRCAHAMPRCASAAPGEITLGEGHTVACWLLEKKAESAPS